MYQSQAELEVHMHKRGRDRAEGRMARNEAEKRAGMNPYAQSVYRRFVLPLAEKIAEDLKCKGAKKRQAHVLLLSPIDPEAVAYIAVRTALVSLMNTSSNQNHTRGLMLEIGKAVYHEYMLSVFEHVEPDLFYALVNDFDRRHTGEEHRLTVFKLQAKAHGIVWNEWPVGAKDQVGGYLLDSLEQLGMVELNKAGRFVHGKVRYEIQCMLNPGVLDMITRIKDIIVETTPFFLPCIEPPREWSNIKDGGFHTPEMRRVNPFCVKVRPADLDHFLQADMPAVLSAINALQRVRWRINGPMLSIMKDVARHFDLDEIISQAETPRPPKPTWLTDGMKKDAMTEDQLIEFRAWKRLLTEWHTDVKLRGTRVGRFYTARSVADQFKDYPALHFVYSADFRGRLYALTTGVSPQGSDMQKALLEFADGKPLLTQGAKDWFCIAGANRYGYDKASLKDRVQWVMDRKDALIRIASDPISYRDWTEADSPLQFLAWCLEFAEWQKHGDAFESRIAVGMDGSCNGLQNFSAMLRDELGGRATNLVPRDKPNDIYQMVANVTTKRLQEMYGLDERRESYRQRWLKHGINRTLVKRSVMTLPYGSTRFSSAEFIEGDYLKAGKVPEFAKDEYRRASGFLSFPVWDSIGDVVVKAREAMEWLQEAAGLIIRAGHSQIIWHSPSGFPVIQSYWEQIDHRIHTKLCGSTKILVPSESKDANLRKHRNGVAPNFVHSLDAAHLTMTINAATSEGITALAMIHDDYGTHAADAPVMYRLIREVFVAMYESNDPLQQFAAAYAEVQFPEQPSKGDLDLRMVLESEYFFS